MRDRTPCTPSGDLLYILRLMNAERLRAFLLTLPHAVETMQWGDNLVFWVGDKAIGGKMFALINLEEDGPQRRRVTQHALMMYPAGPARYAELLECEGILPAPYMARNHWVAVERWEVFTPAEWRRELQAAHAITLGKLPPKTRKILALPASQQRSLVAQSRRAKASGSDAVRSTTAYKR
jgi:predicted DNA-binding protein (MmcQ/YjbR family)